MILPNQTCSDCHQPVPTDQIACPFCVAALDKRAQRISQIPLVGRAVAGEIELRLYRGDDGRKHIRKWGYSVTFCDQACVAARAKTHRDSFIWLDQDNELAKVCAQCLIEFNLLAAEAKKLEQEVNRD